ncbi:Clp protease N-terminal domain-containing protein [Actinomadura macrotermitis]|uniref:Clp R domain-containing protein n=1 Tax=Actinomadura macrotermitis TaxID=2585200 RepID=A0A7K0BTY1_9ACTN|nr:Clp protease N-terminal domain-containing protein [Actinomadura macrotermitis]MQY04362.1 hypothetical protein [Actinomadura macrotermitis]
MFERFSEHARQVIVLAQEESRLLEHGHIGTEHLLLGLLRVHDPLIDQVLAPYGLTLAGARRQVEEMTGKGGGDSGGHVPFTPRAKKTLELGLREALGLGHDYIGTGHLLLGLVDEPDDLAARILTGSGAGLGALRQEVVAAMGAGPAAYTAPPAPREPQADRLAAIEERLAGIEDLIATILERLDRR